jgi:DNA repair protein RadA/Sms
MARSRTAFYCTDCGNETPRWQGQCPACGVWNTLVEEPAGPVRSGAGRPPWSTPPPAASPVRLADVAADAAGRWPTGIDEFDFVLGGGVVPGSVVLVGGEPGIGKSTLLLQVAARLHAAGRMALYVSGEESPAQVRLRAGRLGGAAGDVAFLAETSVERILERAAEARPAVLFVDSIQTVRTEAVESAPGSIGQVREGAALLQRFAKERGVATFLVGHVTKGGVVAGPRTLEHIVDTVLYFESDTGAAHRVLRATKNRFGGADEIGVFRMAPEGLVPVPNPSAPFLDARSGAVSGSAVAATIEGTRPLLVEVQALCTRASWGAAQRVSTGFDRQRLALLLAVLERRAGVAFGELDVFVNVAGGIRVAEPACDLAVCVALASSVRDRVVPARAAFVGEVGLGGELRPVAQLERRLSEMVRLGFDTAYVSGRGAVAAAGDLRVVALDTVADVLGHVVA